MSAPLPDLVNALAPVRDALLRAAREDARRTLDASQAQTRRAISDAEHRAEVVRGEARASGAAAADVALATERAQVRRQGRAIVLRARREAYEKLCTQVEMAGEAIVDRPSYQAMREALIAAAHRELGPDADVVDVRGGGIVARSGRREMDLSLATLAHRAADAVANRLDEL